MAQQLRTLAAFPEDLGSVPSTHVVAHNHLFVTLALADPIPSSGLVGTEHT